jgi:hypothetical protein
MAKVNVLKSLKKAISRIGSKLRLKKCRTRRAPRRKSNRSKKNQKNQRGGGYSEKLDLSIYPGQQVHQAYSGPGYDCAGSATRPGTLNGIGMLQNPGGLAGLSPGIVPGLPKILGGGNGLGSGGPVLGPNGMLINGGKRRKNQKGGTVLGVAVDKGELHGTPESGTPAGSYLQENQIPPNMNAATRSQMGGRYGMEGSPLDPVNAVGMSGYAPIGRVQCESGSLNALNPDPTSAKAPFGVQELTTNRMTYGVPGFTPLMKGGRRSRRNKKRSQKKKNKQRGGVVVGQVDAMRYYAPTAGYSNLPLNPPVMNNPGILMQLGYPAGHFNQACIKTN